MFIVGHILNAIAVILGHVLWLYSLVVMVAVLITWVNPDPFNPIVSALRAMTDPVLHWIRRRVPFAVVGMLDLSPVILLLAIWFVRLSLVPVLMDLAVQLR